MLGSHGPRGDANRSPTLAKVVSTVWPRLRHVRTSRSVRAGTRPANFEGRRSRPALAHQLSTAGCARLGLVFNEVLLWLEIEPASLRDGIYDKVGGWLVLPALATYITPFFMAYASFDNFRYFIFPADDRATNTCWIWPCVCGPSRSAGSMPAFYFPGWIRFPQRLRLSQPGLIIVNFAGTAILSSYTGNAPTTDDNRDLIRSIVLSAIWASYMRFRNA
jgi:hypothetical protein